MKDRSSNERGTNVDKEGHAVAKGTVAGAVAGGVAGGAITGALAGGITGPVGAVIGAAAGAVVGALGGKAKDDADGAVAYDAADDTVADAGKGAVTGGVVGGVAGGAVTGALAGGVTGPVGAAIGAAVGAGAGAVAGAAKDHDTLRSDTSLPGSTPLRTDTTLGRSSGLASSAERTGYAEGEQVIPVVQEELAVGKRTVDAGGVRVESRLVEDTVRESVNLREERAHVERHPVDRPATAADLQGLGERSIEVHESVERPVVQKTARVVEEVVVGKEVRTQQAQIEDTLRHTEVEVERLGGDLRSSRNYADFEPDYRAHFNTTYGSSGRLYEDVEPAYRYGHTLAGDSRYQGRDWSAFEPDAQAEWTRTNSGSRWEDVKDSVRHAWQRAKS
jgi:uncharacterized protein (TIGR02271 family)